MHWKFNYSALQHPCLGSARWVTCYQNRWLSAEKRAKQWSRLPSRALDDLQKKQALSWPKGKDCGILDTSGKCGPPKLKLMVWFSQDSGFILHFPHPLHLLSGYRGCGGSRSSLASFSQSMGNQQAEALLNLMHL